MYIVFTCMVFLGAMVVQTSLLRYVSIGGVRPDLVLIIVVYLGLVRGPDAGSLSGFVFGLFEDAYSGGLLGANALIKTLLGFACGLLGKRLYTQSLLSHFLCVGVGTVANVTILSSLHGFAPEWRTVLMYEVLYNLLCCPVIVALYRYGERFLKPKTSA